MMKLESTPNVKPPKENARILVVEDDANLQGLIVEELEEHGHEIRTAASAEEGVRAAQEFNPDLVVSDLRLPGSSGLDLLRKLRADPFPPSFLIVTAFGTIAQAVEALKEGADNFLTKPLDFEHLRIAIIRALEVRSLKKQVRQFQSNEATGAFHGIMGNDPSMRNLFDQIRRIGQAGGPVLVCGESGSGKELVARALHQESARKGKAFVAVNCAGIPESLMESELFGHLAGSFTGAAKARKGLFQQADGGVLFLDEIAELPAPMQAKLLRVLQENTVRPVGADKETPIDVRIVAATNLDLEEEMRNERFRGDLFHRLDAFQILIPPLRERRGDIDMLAARFLSLYAAEQNVVVKGFSDDALRLLHQYRFPGNVRELQNIVRRAVTFCQGELIQSEDLPRKVLDSAAGQSPLDSLDGLFLPDGWSTSKLPTMEEVKSHYIQQVLGLLKGNKRQAAQALGIGRRTLYRHLGEIDE